MPQPHGQAPHDGDDGDLFLFGVSQHQLLVKLPGVAVMADLHPTGLAQNFAQSWRSLPADVSFAVVLLPAFVASWCQSHILPRLTSAPKPARLSDFSAI